MQEQQLKALVADTFNTVAADYDCHALRFFGVVAQHMVDQLSLQGDESILDIACGTGQVTARLANALPDGEVLGVDLAEGMLQQAHKRVVAQGIDNAKFECVDIDLLQLKNDSLDVISSSFGLFFLPDITRSVAHVKQSLKSGGKMIFSSFTGRSFSPMTEMAISNLAAYGIQAPVASWHRLDSTESHHELLENQDFTNIQTQQIQCGYHLASADEWWDVLWNAGFRSLLIKLPEDELLEFKEYHLKQVAALANEQGIWLDVDVLISQATKV